MPTVDLSDIVKNKLIQFKEEKGCKTYSEAVNLLLELYASKKEGITEGKKKNL